MKKETIAELQARKIQLEQQLAELKGKTDELSKLKIEAANRETAEIDIKVELEAKEAKMAKLEAQEAGRREQDARRAVHVMINRNEIAIRDTATQASWEKRFTEDPSLIEAMKAGDGSTGMAVALRGSQPLVERQTPGGVAVEAQRNGGGYVRIDGGFSVPGAMKQYFEIVAANARLKPFPPGCGDNFEIFRNKASLAKDAARVFKASLAKEVDSWQDMNSHDLGRAIGLSAADYTDPTNNLGTLSGTLVLQRTLPFFAYKFPELMNLYTDFSDTPGLLNQTEMTRIVVQPPVEKFDTTLDASGRPNGWSTVVAAQTTDVALTLTDYIACPIVFSNAQLASTMRRLFDEQAVAAIKAIAAYFVGMVTNLATSGNFNSYAVASATVPNVFPTYVQSQQNFSMADIDSVGAAFSSNKVPEEDRGIMLAPTFFGKLRGDIRLLLEYQGASKTIAAASDMLAEFKLPKLSGFAPYNAPYLPSSIPTTNPTTNNVTGFAFQKNAVILKSRLPQDFTQALGVMIPGSVTTITDPDTKISIMLVQYVDLRHNFAEWRPEVMLGTAVGDKRAGLVFTSQ